MIPAATKREAKAWNATRKMSISLGQNVNLSPWHTTNIHTLAFVLYYVSPLIRITKSYDEVGEYFLTRFNI